MNYLRSLQSYYSSMQTERLLHIFPGHLIHFLYRSFIPSTPFLKFLYLCTIFNMKVPNFIHIFFLLHLWWKSFHQTKRRGNRRTGPSLFRYIIWKNWKSKIEKWRRINKEKVKQSIFQKLIWIMLTFRNFHGSIFLMDLGERAGGLHYWSFSTTLVK